MNHAAAALFKRRSLLLFLKKSIVAAAVVSTTFVELSAAANLGPQTITLDGRLFTSLTSDTALLDPSVVIDVKIYNAGANCMLYEEKQIVDTTQTDGRFTILVGSLTTGSTSAKRVAGEPGNAMATIFQNQNAIAGSCGAYSPSSGENRIVRLTIAPSTTGTIEVLSPDTTIDSVPNAIVAETLQGLDRDHVLAIDSTTTLSQTNVANIFSPTSYPLLTALLAGNSTSYVNSSVNGATLPTVAGVPASLAQGQIWFNSSANAFQYYNGSAVQSLGISGSGISALTVGTSFTANGAAGGTLNSSGTIDLVNSGVAAGTYPKVTVNAKGLVTYGTGLAESDLPIILTPGKVVGDAITSGTIGGSTAFYSSGNVTTTGNLQGLYVTSTYDRTRKLSIYGTGGTNSISFTAPTMTSDYSVVFPAVQGGAGTTLVNDGSGNLSWVGSSSGSVTSVGLALPSIFTVTTPLVTSTGNLTAALANENANLIFAGPASGAAGVPTFRGLTVADLPAGYDASVMKTSLAAGQIWIGNTGGVATAVTPFGDVTLSMTGSGTVTGLEGYPVSAAAPTGNGQVLRWSGSAWVPDFLAMSDLRSTITGAQSLSTCTASQTLVFNSVTDSLACSSIQIANSQITWAATGANLIFAGPASGGAAAPTFRPIAATDLPANAYDSTYFKQGGNAFGATAVVGTTDAQSLLVNTAGLTRLTILSNGGVGVGVATPTARLMLPAGTLAAGTSPLKLTTGSLMTAPEPGAVEFDGTNLYYTDSGSLRHPLAASGSGIAALTGDVTASGNGSVSSTVARVNGVTYPASPGVNTVPVVTATGTVTYETIPNAALTNNSTTLGATVLTLGGTANSVSGLNSLGLGVNGTTSATLTLANGAAGGATTSILPSGSTLSAWSLTLPAGPGTNGYFLTTNGSGLTTWSAPLGSGTVSAGVANQLAVYSTSGSVVNGLTSIANSVLLTDVSGVPSWKLSANDNFSQYALLAGRAGGQLWNGGTGASENVTINSTSHATKGFVAIQSLGGNVGIGTTAPDNSALLTLTVASGASVDLSLNRGSAQQSVPTSYAANDEGRLKFYQSSIDFQRYFDFVTNGGTGVANSNFRFFTNAGSAAALERMRIDGNGNVGIGTTAAGAILDINGTGTSQSAMIVPRDTSANRPTSPVNGMIRYATDLARLETYSSGVWGGLLTSGSSGSSQWTTIGSNIYYSTGFVGIGTTTTPPSPLTIANFSPTATSGTSNALSVTSALNPPSASSANFSGANISSTLGGGGAYSGNVYGLSTTVNNSQPAAVANLVGVYSNPIQSYGGSTVTNLTGTYNELNNTGGNTTSAYGVYNYIHGGAGTVSSAIGTFTQIGPTGSGTITNAYGEQVLISNQGTNTIANAYGEYIKAPVSPSGSITNFYGVYVEAPTVATAKNYAVYSAGGLNYFGGNVGIGTITPGAALDVYGLTTASAMIVPRDTSANRPTSPVNGMIRYATDLARLETYSSGAWSGIATGASTVSSQWTTSGSYLYYNSTSGVGIGSTSPTQSLDVVGSINASVGLIAPILTSAAGSTLSIVPGGTTASTATGLSLNLTGGAAGSYAGVGGSVNINGGAPNNGNQGGAVTITGGGAGSSGNNTGGPVTVAAGNAGSGTGAGGTLTLKSGNAVGNGSGGPLNINAGSGYGASGGTISLTAGTQPNGSYVGGGIALAAGAGSGTNMQGGNITFAGGAPTGSAANGYILFTAGNVGIGTSAPGAALDVNGLTTASAIIVPRDSTTNRPGGVNGMLRYNTTLSQMEMYSSGSWAGLSTTATAGAASQWTTGSASIYYSSGGVGIGTTYPYYDLQVTDATTSPTIEIGPSTTGNGNATLILSGVNAGTGSQAKISADYNSNLTIQPASGRTTTVVGNLQVGSVSSAVQALTYGSTITWSLLNGANASVTLTGNATLALTNVAAGTTGVIAVTQDSTGSRTLALPAGSKVAGGAGGIAYLSTSAAAIDILSFYYDGTTYFWNIGRNYN